MQQEELGVEHHVAGLGVGQHVARVLADAGADEAELAPLAPQAGEVLDHRRVREEALHLVDVEPRVVGARRRDHHAVAHHLERRDHAEHAHVLAEAVHVDVGDAVVERHVALSVEEGEGALHVALVAQRDVGGLGLGLREQRRVEVAERGQAAVPRALPVRLADAARDDRAVALRQALAALSHERAREREHRVGLVRELGGVGAVRDVGGVEGVEHRRASRGELDVRAAERADEVAVLAGRVEDHDLVLGVREHGVGYLALHREALARAGLAAHEAHGARQALAVAQHQVPALPGLPVVASARLVEALAGEGHLHGHLPRGEVAAHGDVVVPEREHRVESLALPEVERLEADRAALRDARHLLDAAVELLEAVGPGVDEARVDEQALGLVAQEVEQLLGLLLREAQLGRQDLVVVALLHGAHLLVDDLLVHPVDLALHERERLALRDGLHVQRHVERQRQVDDGGEVGLLDDRPEAAHREHRAVAPVAAEAVGPALGLEVERGGHDEVLRARSRRRGQFVPGELEARPRAQLPLQKLEPLDAVEGARRAAYARERLLHVAPDARELGHRGVDVVGAHGVGQVAVAHEVRDALAHLVVEDPVVLFGEPGGGALPGLEEDLAADLVGGDGRVHYLELHVGVRREVVEQRAHHGEGRLARLLARGLVADVGELDRLAEHPGHHLGDAVPVHGVVADVGGHLARAVALPAAPLPLGLRALRGVLAPARAAEEQPEGARALRPILLVASCSAHRARLLSSLPCASRDVPGGPGAASPRGGSRRGRARTRAAAGRTRVPPKAAAAPRRACRRAARTRRARTACCRA